jgi:signal transduction histidine kinase
VAQQAALRDNLNKLDAMLKQNKELHERVRRAAARTTALNERYLRNISADLHDGPAQDLALALLRIESLADPHDGDSASTDHLPPHMIEDFRTVRTAVSSALAELRTISAGLRLPAIEPLSPAETIRRAVRDYEQKTQCQVTLNLGVMPDEAPLSVKITLYRVLQEALTNGYRHAGGKDQAVTITALNGRRNELCIEVTDAGTGFDPQSQWTGRHLGLAGMRERVEVLGGRFEIYSAPGPGTRIQATLPLNIPEQDNG